MSLLIQWPRSQTSSHPNGNLNLRKVVLGRRHVLSVVFPSSDSLTTQIHSSETPVHTPPASMGGNTLPRPTRQTPISGSRYGFHLHSPAADSTTSHGNSTVPSASRSTSTVSSSFQGSVPPPSQDCSAAPVSWGGSVAPVSRGRAPTTPVTILTSSVPLRASQIVQRVQNCQPRPLSRTFSVHDLNVKSRPQSFSTPAPPPYAYHADEDSVTEHSDDCNGSPPHRPAFDETDIDEVSPDEDERMAEAALHTPGMDTSFIKFSTNNTPGARLSIPWCKFSPRPCANIRTRYIHFLYQIPY